MPTQAACHKTRNTAFINPTSASPNAIAAALKMCDHCPIKKQCAQDALTAGSSLNDGATVPASDVIQGGVVCYGDYETTVKLSRVAGLAIDLGESERRSQAPDKCRNCGRQMVQWHRAITPDGYVKHYARGFCTRCRSAYTRWKKENNITSAHRGLRKPIDRKRHSAPPKKNRVVTVQPALFEVGA